MNRQTPAEEAGLPGERFTLLPYSGEIVRKLRAEPPMTSYSTWAVLCPYCGIKQPKENRRCGACMGEFANG